MNVAQSVYYMVVKNVPQQICLVTCDLERNDTSPVKSLHIFTHACTCHVPFGGVSSILH